MKKLPAELRTRINKASHAAGLKHGEQIRRRLLAEAEAMLTDGRTVPEIVVHLADALATKKTTALQPNRKDEP